MKTNAFWASIALSHCPAVLAQSTWTSAEPPSTTSVAPSCTASLITTLCDYPSPGPEFAVAEDSRTSCWAYCNSHPLCDFVIFNPGNPHTGTGTCWLYPGQTFDASKGSSDCGNPYLAVYGQPVCDGGSATTTTSGACSATASPSAVASVCGYPEPEDCFNDCIASEGASHCLSQCAKADSCNYVVFNPGNPSNTPYASGTCWMYANGTYDAGSVTPCSDAPQQFVYDNLCPKPSSSSSSHSPSVEARSNGTEPAGAAAGSTTTSENLAPTGLSVTNPLALGVAVLLWHGF